MPRALVVLWASAGLVSACNVPIERFHRPDGPSGDAAIDGPLDPLVQQAYVKASNAGAGDLYGKSIASSADGSTLAVGAYREASAATGIDGDPLDDTATDAGAVYVLTRNGTTWSQQAYVKASNTELDDFFGNSVALSADGSTLVVAAVSEDSAAVGIGGNEADNAAGAAGAVYVFVRSGATWMQQAYVKASNTEAGDGFGTSIALSADGSTLAVGAAGEDSAATGIGGDQANNAASDAGAVYVFVRSGMTWSQQAYVKGSVVTAFDELGTSVALSADGSTLAVGSSRQDSPVANVGAVHVFTRSGTVWSQQTRQTRSQAMGAFGNSVALSADGSMLAVGSSREDGGGTSAGAVYVLTRTGTAWSQQARLAASITGAGDRFGESVTLSADGAVLVVGASGEDGATTGIGGDQADDSAVDAGAAYVLTRSGTTWSQRAYVKASNTGAGDGFGGSVTLSADGAVLAVGASGEDSGATAVNGSQADDSAEAAGAVYVLTSSLR